MLPLRQLKNRSASRLKTRLELYGKSSNSLADNSALRSAACIDYDGAEREAISCILRDCTRREFSVLLPLLLTASPLASLAQAQPGSLPTLEPGRYTQGEAYGEQRPARTAHRFLIGMLPDKIRLEAHFTVLTPGAGPEPVEHHRHTEMWLVHSGEVTLMTAGVKRTLKAGEMGLAPAGTDHSVYNASQTEPASYFVVAVGPPE